MSLETRRGYLLVTRSAPELRGTLLGVPEARNVRIYKLRQGRISESHPCFTLLFGSCVECVKSIHSIIPSSKRKKSKRKKFNREELNFASRLLHQKRSLRPETFFEAASTAEKSVQEVWSRAKSRNSTEHQFLAFLTNRACV